jgi:hypothetical protein
MPRRKQDAHLYDLAKRGALAQFRDLVQEAKHLMELFPHLRDSFDKDELPLSFIIRRDAGAATRASAAKRPKRRLSGTARSAAGTRRMASRKARKA